MDSTYNEFSEITHIAKNAVKFWKNVIIAFKVVSLANNSKFMKSIRTEVPNVVNSVPTIPKKNAVTYIYHVNHNNFKEKELRNYRIYPKSSVKTDEDVIHGQYLNMSEAEYAGKDQLLQKSEDERGTSNMKVQLLKFVEGDESSEISWSNLKNEDTNNLKEVHKSGDIIQDLKQNIHNSIENIDKQKLNGDESTQTDVCLCHCNMNIHSKISGKAHKGYMTDIPKRKYNSQQTKFPKVKILSKGIVSDSKGLMKDEKSQHDKYILKEKYTAQNRITNKKTQTNMNKSKGIRSNKGVSTGIFRDSNNDTQSNISKINVFRRGTVQEIKEFANNKTQTNITKTKAMSVQTKSFPKKRHIKIQKNFHNLEDNINKEVLKYFNVLYKTATDKKGLQSNPTNLMVMPMTSNTFSKHSENSETDFYFPLKQRVRNYNEKKIKKIHNSNLRPIKSEFIKNKYVTSDYHDKFLVKRKNVPRWNSFSNTRSNFGNTNYETKKKKVTSCECAKSDSNVVYPITRNKNDTKRDSLFNRNYFFKPSGDWSGKSIGNEERLPSKTQMKRNNLGETRESKRDILRPYAKYPDTPNINKHGIKFGYKAPPSSIKESGIKLRLFRPETKNQNTSKHTKLNKKSKRKKTVHSFFNIVVSSVQKIKNELQNVCYRIGYNYRRRKFCAKEKKKKIVEPLLQPLSYDKDAWMHSVKPSAHPEYVTFLSILQHCTQMALIICACAAWSPCILIIHLCWLSKYIRYMQRTLQSLSNEQISCYKSMRALQNRIQRKLENVGLIIN